MPIAKSFWMLKFHHVSRFMVISFVILTSLRLSTLISLVEHFCFGKQLAEHFCFRKHLVEHFCFGNNLDYTYSYAGCILNLFVLEWAAWIMNRSIWNDFKFWTAIANSHGHVSETWDYVESLTWRSMRTAATRH